MSIRDGLIVAGIVILALVLADLIRRYLKRDKLRLSIDDQFRNLPDVDLSPELPNGGARAVDTLSENSPLAKAEEASSDRVKAVAAGAREHQAEPAGEPCSEPETWVIDPILSCSREPDDQVDLLLEREFKGVGKGESHGLSPLAPFTAAQLDPVGDVSSTAKEPDCAGQEDTAEADGFLSVPAFAAGTAPVTAPDTTPDTTPVTVPVTTGSKAAKAVLGLVTDSDSDLIDLERPVHELLQARHSARSTVATEKPVEKPAEKPAKTITEPSVARKTSAKRAPAVRKPESQPSFFDLDPDLAPIIEAAVKPAPKPKSRRRRKKVEQVEAEQSALEASVESAPEEQVLVINVLAKHAPFSAPTLFKLVEACGLEFGAMDIFHRYEQAKGQGALQFSMANAVRPGTFDPSQQPSASTPAVTFFLRLADPTDRMSALECMLATAQCVADNLGGELKDENRSSLRTQTIEHYRQKVREFERKALTRRS
ncbi:MAG: cell division protein ZipA [Motiliproteus sp.]